MRDRERERERERWRRGTNANMREVDREYWYRKKSYSYIGFPKDIFVNFILCSIIKAGIFVALSLNYL